MTNLKKYYQSCNDLATEFCKKYFNVNYDFWVSDESGGVLVVGDYFFNMEQIVTTMEIKPSFKRLDEAYWYFIDNKKPKISFENYLRYGLKIK
jgi:predicted nucleotidyltransferase